MNKLPEVLPANESNSSSKHHELWIRIQAFLSLKSANTQRTYESIIREWSEFLSGEAPGSSKSADAFLAALDLHAIAYINFLRNKKGQNPRISKTKLSKSKSIATQVKRKKAKADGTQSTLTNSTIRKKIAALRKIYKMLIAAGVYSNTNPFDSEKLQLPSSSSGQKRPTEMVDFSKVMEIIEAPNSKTEKGIRDKALLAVLFGGGLRRSEAVSLLLSDVRESSKGTMYLRLRATKSGKDSDQALPQWAADHVKELLKIRSKHGAEAGEPLFISYRGKGCGVPSQEAISDSGIYKLFKRYCNKVGVNEFVTPHSARATSITKLLDEGLSHREVQEFSRHSSVQMVEVYDKRRYGVDQNPAKSLNFSTD